MPQNKVQGCKIRMRNCERQLLEMASLCQHAPTKRGRKAAYVCLVQLQVKMNKIEQELKKLRQDATTPNNL
jgi:hypothetical protein